MEFNRLSPYVRLALDSTMETPWELKERVIPDYALFFIKQGSLFVTVSETGRICSTGDVIFIRPGEPHHFRSIGNVALHLPHVYFDPCYNKTSPNVSVSLKLPGCLSETEQKLMAENQTNENLLPFPSFLELEQLSELGTRFAEVIDCFNRHDEYREFPLMASMLQLLHYIASHQKEKCSPSNHSQRFSEIKAYLAKNSNRSVSLEELTERFDLSKYYLVRQFKAQFGESPIQYHHRVMLERAKHLLLYGGIPVSTAARQLGFENTYDFSRFFKRYTGVAPSNYPESLRG